MSGSIELQIYDELESAAHTAKELAYGGAAAGTCVVARAQSAGVGRRGHFWHSPLGGLYLACVVRPKAGMGQYVALPVVGALGLLDSVRDLGLASAQILWPNDVVVDLHKVGSVSVEAGYGEAGMFAIVSAALNLAPTDEVARSIAEQFDGQTHPLEPAFMGEHLQELPELEDMAALVAEHIMARVDAWDADISQGAGAAGPFASVLGEYFDSCALIGQPCVMRLPDGRAAVRGIFGGLDIWGHAIVVDSAGVEHSFSAEQVSMRPDGPEAH